jgi:hypothetical protein
LKWLSKVRASLSLAKEANRGQTAGNVALTTLAGANHIILINSIVEVEKNLLDYLTPNHGYWL